MKNRVVYQGDPHKAKKKFDNYKKQKVVKNFWNEEYREDNGKKFELSKDPSSDFLKFVKWIENQYKGQNPINENTFFVDAGCGNGRNSIYLTKTYGAKGVGYDLSTTAIQAAKKDSKGLSGLQFLVKNLNEPIPAEDGSADIIIDAVASHVLRKDERISFRNEVVRVLSSGSYYFLKSLLLDEDSNAKEMIREFGKDAGEPNSYIHPTIGIFEHVPTETELIEFYREDFEIDKIERSYKGSGKRRYIVMYLRKK